MGEHREHGEYEEHGKDVKHQPDDLKHSTNNSKHFICDSKHLFWQSDDSNTLYYSFYGDSRINHYRRARRT